MSGNPKYSLPILRNELTFSKLRTSDISDWDGFTLFDASSASTKWFARRTSRSPSWRRSLRLVLRTSLSLSLSTSKTQFLTPSAIVLGPCLPCASDIASIGSATCRDPLELLCPNREKIKKIGAKKVVVDHTENAHAGALDGSALLAHNLFLTFYSAYEGPQAAQRKEAIKAEYDELIALGDSDMVTSQ